MTSGTAAVRQPPPVAYAFDAALHALPEPAHPAGSHVDAWGTWPVLAVPREALATPLAIGFDAAFERLAALERMYAEPDGSFVWTSPREGLCWQVDGNAFERHGRVLLVDLKGTCPADRFDARAAHVQPRDARELERRMLDALHVVLVVLLRQLCQIEAVAVLDGRLRARAAHAGAGLQLFEHLAGQPAGLLELLGRSDQRFELVSAVEWLAEARRLWREAECEASRRCFVTQG